MKQPQITRRQFFKLNAFGIGAIAAASLASIAAPAPQQAQASAADVRSILPQPTFNAVPSALETNRPPADVSMGWDGTVWAIDAMGAPHLFDPQLQQWTTFGDGLDAAAWVGTLYYWFKGNEFVSAPFGGSISAVQQIGDQWPSIPYSFKMGLTGAANIGGTLVFFRGGWYAPADGSSPLARLIDLPNWPQTQVWGDGVIDAVHGDGSANVLLFRSGEYLIVNLQTQAIVAGPVPLAQYPPWQNRLPTDWDANGFDAAFTVNGSVVVYNGALAAVFNPANSTPTAVDYIGALNEDWPAAWHPVLNHAPSGRTGSLWAATQNGGAVQHDGDTWIVRDAAGESVTSVTSGGDGSTYLCGSSSNILWQWRTGEWQSLATHSTGLSQVAAGGVDHVWVRDVNNVVHQFNPVAGLTAVALGAGVPNPTHMAANLDGTLWHCNSANPNAFRFISEAGAPSAGVPIKPGLTSSVQKVASTGFGAAHCLALHSDGSTQIYRYDSPYVFKTADAYRVYGTEPMAQGLGRLYFVQVVDNVGNQELKVRIVAIDVHTGAELASFTPLNTKSAYTGIVFDPLHELVYVGVAPLGDIFNNAERGALFALDARTLEVAWVYQTAAGVDATPTLSGTQLCVGDRTNAVYMFDTAAALAAAMQEQPITPKWKVATGFSGGETGRVSTPIITNGTVYGMVWDVVAQYNKQQTNVGGVFSCDAATGDNMIAQVLGVDDNVDVTKIVLPPVLGTVTAPNDESVFLPALWFNTYHTIWAVALNNGQIVLPLSRAWTLPAGGTAITSFAYDDGTRLGPNPPGTPQAPDPHRVWFADAAGNLWALNASLQPVDNTPYNLGQQTTIYTTPLLYKDPSGGATVLFGLDDKTNTQPPSLYGYDPASGRHVAVPTGVTQIWNLSKGAENGVVYAAGGGTTTPDGQVSQVFGIRVDELPQALRDFIIESQMMQDPDPTAPGGNHDADNPVPPSRARFQTHLTIVDDQKKPLMHEAVKVWADQPMTIQIDGTAYNIGPGDAQFAHAKTGVDGALVITSGYAKPNGSDTPDMYVPALRVWAAFMDPFERMVVNPDAEFHIRVSTAHADNTINDPNRVNLSTTQSYAGRNGAAPTPLFTADEVSAGQPGNCATAIGQMKSGVGFGGGGPANATGALFSRLMLQGRGQQAAGRAIRANRAVSVATPAPKYTAYDSLSGIGYFPANVPAKRSVSAQQPVGLMFTKAAQAPTSTAQLQVIHHTEAQAHMDALPAPSANPPWLQPAFGRQGADGMLVVRGTANIFTDFWNWLKGAIDTAIAEITHIIISVADAVMVGIRMIVNGVEQVFKAIVKVIDDIASAIGSFFKMLIKLIEDVIAALSVLFHFGEIMWTHRWMANQFITQVAGLAQLVKDKAKPAVDGFFQAGEDAIKTIFAQLRNDLGQSDQINSMKGATATAHTVLNGGRNDSDQSQAVQGGWGVQKMKAGLPNSPGNTASRRVRSDEPTRDERTQAEPITDFFSAFVARLTNDSDLGQTFTQLKMDFGNLFQANSAQQFFSTLLTTLLDIVEALLVGALAVTNAFVDGFLAVVDDAINAVLEVLNAEIDIPVLTWLYETLFGEPLTFLNLATLVAAIPVTIIIRVAEGAYPSQLLPPASITGTQRSAAASPIVQKVLACFNAIFTFVIGICSGLSDAVGEAGGTLTSVAGKISLGLGLVLTAMSTPSISSDDPSGADWVLFGIGVAWALSGVLALDKFKLADPNPTVGTWCNTCMSLMFFIAGAVNFGNSGDRSPTANAGFAAVVIGSVPAILGPIKLLPEPAPLVVAVLDVAGGVGAAVAILFNAFLTSSTMGPGPHRLYVPNLPALGRLNPWES